MPRHLELQEGAFEWGCSRRLCKREGGTVADTSPPVFPFPNPFLPAWLFVFRLRVLQETSSLSPSPGDGASLALGASEMAAGEAGDKGKRTGFSSTAKHICCFSD